MLPKTSSLLGLVKAKIVVAVDILFLFATFAVWAADVAPVWTLNSFGTFDLSGTDTGDLEFRRDLSQSNGVSRSWGVDPDSRLGLQLDVDFNRSFHAAVQWVARNHPGNFFEQNLDWAFLRWRPQIDLDLRVGRLGFDVFLLSDYRNVGYAYLWVRPPHEFYGSLPVYHFDGADIAKKFTLDQGYLTLKGFAGYASYQVPGGLSSTFDAASALAGGSLAYEGGNWRARVGYVYTQSTNEAPSELLFTTLDDPQVNAVWPGARSLIRELSIKNTSVQYSSVGLAYDDGEWLAQGEAAYIHSDSNTFPTLVDGYVSLGRRFGKLTPYLLLGIAETLDDQVKVPDLLLPVPELIGLRNTVDGLLNNNGIDQKSVSLGLRWDVYENIAIKAQWSHFWLGENGTQLWVEPASGPTPRNVNLWSLGVDFLF